MKCSNCGKQFEGKFCPYCGSAGVDDSLTGQPQTSVANDVPVNNAGVKCPHCGKQFEGKFCPYCGSAGVDDSLTGQPQTSVANDVPVNNAGVKCPRCGSGNLQAVSDVQGKGVSALKLCLCGIFGLCGSGKTKTKHYWVCSNCGNKFKM